MLPNYCPSCQAQLKVESLKCINCQTEVTLLSDLPILASLPENEYKFILRFVINSGSQKKMASELNLSYPTVRNILNKIIIKIKNTEN